MLTKLSADHRRQVPSLLRRKNRKPAPTSSRSLNRNSVDRRRWKGTTTSRRLRSEMSQVAVISVQTERLVALGNLVQRAATATCSRLVLSLVRNALWARKMTTRTFRVRSLCSRNSHTWRIRRRWRCAPQVRPLLSCNSNNR